MKILIILGMLIPFALFAQIDMNVNKISGSTETLKIVNNNQITFQSATANDVMYVKKNDGTTDVYKLSDVNVIIFDGIPITGLEETIPNQFTLENFPNPFEQKTTISFKLEKSGKIELNLFDLNGIIISSFINEDYEAGEHKFEWDGSNSEGKIVSPGIYFCQLKVENEILTKKMIIIK